jgi:ornithine cyclodeaminase
VFSLAIVNPRAVSELLSLSDAIELVALAMRELSGDLVYAPERTGHPVSSHGKLVLMPGAMPHIQRFGVKTLSLVSNASEHGLPSHQGLMLLFDGLTGRPLCAIDSHALTALRTAAASAVATRALARAESSILALIGCGSLARLHVEAMCLVRPIDEIRVWSRTAERTQSFAREIADRFALRTEAASSVREAVDGADIVCTLTSSDVPVLHGEWLEPGQHLNLVGASTRAAREADDQVVARSRYIADSRPHALSQAGELRHAIEHGFIQESHVVGEIGEVLSGTVEGRTDASTITLYKSLGHVAQDLRVADAISSRLARSNQVVWVPWPQD